MSGIGFSKIINEDFIRRFTQLAKSGNSARNSIFSKQTETESLGAGLRIGARTFSTAIDGLNAATSLVNLSEQTLEDLKEVTTSLINISKQAAEVSTSQGQRIGLDQKFHELAGEFRNLVKNGTTGTNEFLTKDGLAEIFRAVGLDEKSSETIASIFSSFITPKTDSALASEFAGVGSENIPVGAFTSRASDVKYNIDKLTNSAITSGGIGKGSSVFVDYDTILNQNPSFQSVLNVDQTGSIRGLGRSTLQFDVTLLAVNESNGYALITTRNDLLGQNGGNYNQIFLVDNTGQVLQQYTDNSNDFAEYMAADVSADNLTVAYAIYNSLTSEQAVYSAVTSSLGADPFLGGVAYTKLVTETPGLNFTDIAINNNASYVVFKDDSAGSHITFMDLNSLSIDFFIDSETDIEDFGFIGESDLAIKTSTEIKSYKYDSGAYSTLASYSSIGKFTTLESLGSIGVQDSSTNTIYILNSSAEVEFSLDLAGTDSIQSLSLAESPDGTKSEIGVVGSLTSITGDSDTELYRFTYNQRYDTGQRSSRSTPDFYNSLSGQQNNSIFDDDRHITSRSEAFRALADLENLAKQIDSNLTVLKSAKSTLEDNIKLLRTSGRAFLEASERVSNIGDAESLALSLNQRIRSLSSSKVLSQAENLNAITVAALTRS